MNVGAAGEAERRNESGASGTTSSAGLSGGADAAGGGGADAAGGAGAASGGGAGRAGSAAPSGEGSGCPLELEGFATLEAEGQNGTFGGRDGETVTVTTQADLDRYATAAEPYTIRVSGAITFEPKGTEIRLKSHKTIIGVGANAAIVQGGFMLEAGVHNVIIRNLTIRDSFVEGDLEGKTQDFDGVQMDTAHHIWIDHCHLQHMGDGLIDSRKDTTYLTVSWNVLSDHNKTFGIGWTENVTAQMTIHHNWFRDVNQRVPSIDNVLRAHLYNNYLLRVAAYGNYARGATNLVLENSVFDTVKDPHYADTGSLAATGNVYRNVSGRRETKGAAFFDPSSLYEYTLHAADQVQALLEKCAGPRSELGN
jgi:pectate lyase